MFGKEDLRVLLPNWLYDTQELDNPIDQVPFRLLSIMKQLGEHLVIRAAHASRKSQSYRPFPVGCAVLGMNGSSPRGSEIFTGHNMKVHGDARVTCGEVIAVGAARQAGFSQIPLIAVVGNAQPDHGSGVNAHTLHPCFRCRDEFSSLTEISSSTVIITATFDAAVALEEDSLLSSDVEVIDASNVKEPEIDLDLLIESRQAEAFSFNQLLTIHK